ncbi:MAG: response regulator [Bacteroidales bacterium]|nr:response regulator [Bacteroidales bacterium]
MDRIKGTVLISDRNKGLLTALVLLLQKVFSRVVTEAEPARIVEMAATGDIDIVVLDTGQNGGSGQKEHIRLVEEIVALKQNVQVVVLTNFGQSAYAMELAEAGAFDFVPKPWNNEKLLVTLRNAFQMRQLSNALRQVGMMDGEMENDDERNVKSSGREKVNEKILTLEQMEKKMMKAAIKRNRGNISLAAEQLGVTRQTLYNKGKKYKLFE